MRHRDQSSVLEALEDWKGLRLKVQQEGGEQYEQPVLVKFLDTGTFEVMDRDIVEDEFYVLRRHKILRELDAQGRDCVKEVSMVKAYMGELVNRVMYDCVQLHGGMGYMRESPIERPPTARSSTSF